MDIQAAGAQGLTLPGNGDLLPYCGAVIRQKDGGGACQQGIHPAFHSLTVAQGDGYAVPLGKRIGFHLHSHMAVQRNHSQRTVLHHQVGDLVTRLTVEGLYPSGNSGGDAAADGILLGGGQLLVQRLDFILHIRHGAADGGHLHQRQQVAFLHNVAVFHQGFRDLHPLGDGKIPGIHIAEGAGAGDQRADGAPADGIAEHLGIQRGELLPNLTAQGGNPHHQHHCQGQQGNANRQQDPAAALLSGFSQCLKQGIVFGTVGIFFLFHSFSFRISPK